MEAGLFSSDVYWGMSPALGNYWSSLRSLAKLGWGVVYLKHIQAKWQRNFGVGAEVAKETEALEEPRAQLSLVLHRSSSSDLYTKM
jgi:hypothetical protein